MLSADFAEAARAGEHDRMGEINREFHSAIGRASGNKYVADLYDSQLTISLRLARMVFADSPRDDRDQADYYNEVVRQHDAMVAAIEAGDAEAADALARDHIALFRARVQAYIEHNLAGELPLPD